MTTFVRTADPVDEDEPRKIVANPPVSDRIFEHGSRVIGFAVLIITGSIGVFLALQSIPTLREYGFGFFTQSQWNPDRHIVGIASVLLGTLTVALVALFFAFPMAFGSALYISEYAPPKLKSLLVSMVDLMAAVPSIVYGLWGFFLIQPAAIYVARWINAYFGWMPWFHVQGDAHAAIWQESNYVGSAFIAGIAVAMMVIPMGCAVMREVFSHAPVGEREAAYALGATRWGMVRAVVLPFGRGGIIGGTMLSLGRALGETIAVVLIISPAFDLKFRPLEVGTITVSSLIAGRVTDAGPTQLSALLTAGFVLFLITLFVNTAAATIVSRGRSGAGTDI
ncbi:MAG TPA: phosphate ABC transporter permease subunit PstC [Jatrophihabitantaceae bacterium]|jgi:phosphate transport system permease protein|nr:phosphate ABC transporter permease subunit PstC [Jatrophihabitantaceae bacterium]